MRLWFVRDIWRYTNVFWLIDWTHAYDTVVFSVMNEIKWHQWSTLVYCAILIRKIANKKNLKRNIGQREKLGEKQSTILWKKAGSYQQLLYSGKDMCIAQGSDWTHSNWHLSNQSKHLYTAIRHKQIKGALVHNIGTHTPCQSPSSMALTQSRRHGRR